MSFRTDQCRTNIAKDLLAAMLSGVMSIQVAPWQLDTLRQGIMAMPRLAVVLTDMLTSELDGKTESDS